MVSNKQLRDGMAEIERTLGAYETVKVGMDEKVAVAEAAATEASNATEQANTARLALLASLDAFRQLTGEIDVNPAAGDQKGEAAQP